MFLPAFLRAARPVDGAHTLLHGRNLAAAPRLVGAKAVAAKWRRCGLYEIMRAINEATLENTRRSRRNRCEVFLEMQRKPYRAGEKKQR